MMPPAPDCDKRCVHHQIESPWPVVIELGKLWTFNATYVAIVMPPAVTNADAVICVATGVPLDRWSSPLDDVGRAMPKDVATIADPRCGFLGQSFAKCKPRSFRETARVKVTSPGGAVGGWRRWRSGVGEPSRVHERTVASHVLGC